MIMKGKNETRKKRAREKTKPELNFLPLLSLLFSVDKHSFLF